MIVVDDVLTAGTHFRAAKSILGARFSDTRIIGLFIARRVPGTTGIEDLPFKITLASGLPVLL